MDADITAIREGNLVKVKELAESGFPFDKQNEFGKTPLMGSIEYGHRNIAEYLTDKVSRQSLLVMNREQHWNALHLIANYGRHWPDIWSNIVQKAPVCLNHVDSEGRTPEQLLEQLSTSSERHAKLAKMLKAELPSFVKELDEESISNYLTGLDEHAEETRNIKIMLIGHEMVGKTCLVKQLFGEHIDLQSHHSTNVAELHLRRLLLDMRTLERISGTSAKDIVLERLRMVISEIKDGNPND
ncbi:uncharacterized protein LOC117332838 [Pecten maximus]|uniref:uncharacterized protein LOC117332838 n=1 Tax=Pecten maximus TaxID=6579 RepID=UPI00145840CF|nr:uncharacterized protein LOC117332838 [Pecten maximus]